LSDAVWGEEARNSERSSEMFWMWGRGTQEVGVSKEKEKKERRSSTTVRSMGEGKETQ